MPKSRRLVLALSTALLVGIGGPAVDVALKCRRSEAHIAAACPDSSGERLGPCPAASEACVWGKALLPVSIGASLFLLGFPVALLTYWWTGRRGLAPSPGA